MRRIAGTLLIIQDKDGMQFFFFSFLFSFLFVAGDGVGERRGETKKQAVASSEYIRRTLKLETLKCSYNRTVIIISFKNLGM